MCMMVLVTQRSRMRQLAALTGDQTGLGAQAASGPRAGENGATGDPGARSDRVNGRRTPAAAGGVWKPGKCDARPTRPTAKRQRASTHSKRPPQSRATQQVGPGAPRQPRASDPRARWPCAARPHTRATGRARLGRAHGAHVSTSARTSAHTLAHAHAPHTPRVRDTTAPSGLVTRQRPRDAVGKHPRLCACTHSTAHTATQHTQTMRAHIINVIARSLRGTRGKVAAGARARTPPPARGVRTARRHALGCHRRHDEHRTLPSTSGATRLAAQPPAPARAAAHVVPRTSAHKHRPHPAQRHTSPSAVAQTAANSRISD
jgi:hypothetical protein